jgi:hypothetical protein
MGRKPHAACGDTVDLTVGGWSLLIVWQYVGACEHSIAQISVT